MLMLAGAAVACLASAPRGAAETNPELTFQVRIPALAADSGPVTPNPDPGLVAVLHLGTGLHGGLVAYGEVANGTAGAIAGITVTATARSRAGVLLSTRTVEALTPVIGTGSTGLFRVAFPGVTDGDAVVTVKVASFARAVEAPPPVEPGAEVTGPTPLVVLVVDPVTKELITTYSTTISVLKGSVKNVSAAPVGRIRAMVALYDHSGNVAFIVDATNISVNFQPPGPVVLAPGQTGTFEATIDNTEYLAIPGPVVARAFVSAGN